MNGLDPRFVQMLMALLANPPAQVDIAVNLFFPDIAQEFARWSQMQINGNFALAYEWMQKKFPSAQLLDENLTVDELYRELLKHILAKAFNTEYHQQIIVH